MNKCRIGGVCSHRKWCGWTSFLMKDRGGRSSLSKVWNMRFMEKIGKIKQKEEKRNCSLRVA